MSLTWHKKAKKVFLSTLWCIVAWSCKGNGMALWGPSINNQYEGTLDVCAYIQWAKLWRENLCEGFFGPPKNGRKRPKKSRKRRHFYLQVTIYFSPLTWKMGKYCVYNCARHCHFWFCTKKSDFSSSTSAAAAATQLLLLCWRIFFGALDRTNSVSPIGRLIKRGGKYTDYFLNVFFCLEGGKACSFLGRVFFLCDTKKNKK